LGVDRIITIHGKDHPTIDGTPLRDFIHVSDLASAHVAALEKSGGMNGHHIFNIATGSGTTVLQLVKLFSQASGRPVPHEFAGRRQGDISISVADCTKANHVLGWRAKKSISEIVESCLWWQAHVDGRMLQ
jgi:UDP-glucose 4-epimerase